MGQQFEIRIVGMGPNGCDSRSLPGERLSHRCKKLDCVDCRALDFVQMLRQYGYLLGIATIVHHHGTTREVTDDMLKNERRSGVL